MLSKISINRNIFIPKKIDMPDFSWSEFLAGSAVAKGVDEVIRYYRRKSTTNQPFRLFSRNHKRKRS
jgi:hypothetical protein